MGVGLPSVRKRKRRTFPGKRKVRGGEETGVGKKKNSGCPVCGNVGGNF